MKVKQVYLAGFLLLLTGVTVLGCNTANKSNPTVSVDSTKVTSSGDAITGSKETLKGCYIAVLKRDTLQLAITSVNGESVEGSLIFNFAEKDRSKGQFEGKYKNGILAGNYKFNSEGTFSERQVIFKKVQGGFIEGFGKVKMVNNKEVFVKEDEAEFDQTNIFRYTEKCLN